MAVSRTRARWRHPGLILLVAVGLVVAIAAPSFADDKGTSAADSSAAAEQKAAPAAATKLIPKPVSLTASSGSFTLTAGTRIATDAPSRSVAVYLAQLLRKPTGYALPLTAAPAGGGAISLTIVPTLARVGGEGYRLDVTAAGIQLRARTPAGLFHGVQTLRQLLPASVERRTKQPGPWTVPGVTVLDHPRFAYRGAHLDVARHFFTVANVKRYIDEIALYKLNVLHLHLTDDQGWRIMINSWPKLATVGGRTEVGGGKGGYFTQNQYRAIVRYAASRHITIVPEVDMPGHVNAALVAYAELNCDGKARKPYTGIAVGFSSLCLTKEITYKFVEDVVREISAMTPGPWFHIGGDEAQSTDPGQYSTFIGRVEGIVRANGKTMVGWVPGIDAGKATPGSVGQYFQVGSGTSSIAQSARDAAKKGLKLIMSPANKVYLDMKYDESSPVGLTWAGTVSVKDSYQWDPVSYVSGVGGKVLGLESALWSETTETMRDLEYLLFPRVAGVGEVGWSPRKGRAWAEYRSRLAAQGPRWEALRINFYRSPDVAWPK